MGTPVRHTARTPEHATDELLEQLRAGDQATPTPNYRPDTSTEPAASQVPPVIASVLASADRALLLSMATGLSEAVSSKKRIVFCTPVGDITCRYMWSSSNLSHAGHGLFFVKIRSSDMVFTPREGAEMDVVLDDAARPVRVMCMMAPLRIYTGVDLLCFMPHNSPVQKNGKLRDDAPSVVSGEASNEVADGEPIRSGEVPERAPAEKMARISRDFDTIRQASL